MTQPPETERITSRAPEDDGSAREIYQERVSGPAGDQVVRSEHVSVPSDATRRGVGVTRVKQVIYFIFGAINVLLVIRFVLLLLGANEASPFVSLIYGLSRAFVLPFSGIFPEPTLGGSVFEWATLVGIAIYALVAYGLARIIELIYAPARPTVTGGS
jgi:YGGT family